MRLTYWFFLKEILDSFLPLCTNWKEVDEVVFVYENLGLTGIFGIQAYEKPCKFWNVDKVMVKNIGKHNTFHEYSRIIQYAMVETLSCWKPRKCEN